MRANRKLLDPVKGKIAPESTMNGDGSNLRQS